MRQFLLFNDEFLLRFGNAFAQFGERFLLEFELGVVGHRQRFAFLIQAIAPTGNDLKRTLGTATAIGDLYLQALISLGQCRTLPIDFFLRVGVQLLGKRKAFLLRGQTHFTLLDAIIGQHRQLEPARVILVEFLYLTLPVHVIIGQLRQP